MTIPQPIAWTPDAAVRILDQTLLPDTEQYLTLETVDAVAEAIRTLRVRGAPLIGIAAAMGVTLALRRGTPTLETVCAASALLGATRPTAVNLRWALDRMERRAAAAMASGEDLGRALRDEASAIWDEDRAMCARIGVSGAALIEGDALVLTHCNAGALATGGMGTALAPVYTLHEAGRRVAVVADETRPLLQGARLTVWELRRLGIEHALLVDAAAAGLLRAGEAQAVVTGFDRVAANGDVANKVGTYGLALAAQAAGVPFVAAGPSSSIDLRLATGDEIEIEERGADEVRSAAGALLTVTDTPCRNPAFDVTPAALVSALVTERGTASPVTAETVAQVA